MSFTSSPPPEWDRLLVAAQKNRPETIQSLIKDEGVDPSHANPVGQSALHIASLWGHVESVRVLLELGADVNASNTITGATPLHCAVQSNKAALSVGNRWSTIQLLLQAGADASRGDFFGSIPMDYLDDDDDDNQQEELSSLREMLEPAVPAVFAALRERNLEQLSSLLEHDPTVMTSRYKDATPVLFTVSVLLLLEKEDSEIGLRLLQLLLENGADPDATPTAHRNGHFRPQEYPGDASLHQICIALKEAFRENDDTNVCEFKRRAAMLLKQHGATIMEPTQQLLHDAARRNQVDMVQFLVNDLAVCPNVKGRQGMTPLQFAARSGNTQVVEFLLSQPEIDLDIPDDRGQTALEAARVNHKTEIVALLEQHSATATPRE